MPTLLIANRGEIALRILRTAKLEGYQTVAIFSDADQNAPHAAAADIAIPIGGNTPQESYLDISKLIQAAKAGGADCVHPGYGFVSENPAFARACIEAGLSFIGPCAEAIELMGNKRRAKEFAIGAGVPCIPGYQGSQQCSELRRHASEIGYPVILKAAAGGGGRGMRTVHEDMDFEAHYHSARAEALSAFGSDELILEKAVLNARHIEIQIFADQHGNCIYLGERDCSIQRRHQKIVEEAPSPAVSPRLRKKMGNAATALARACQYVGAGTVEFLLDENDNFYFLEMNTRLQVEHGITEMITGTDLVAWQLAVARGEPLPLSQEDVHLSGHAIEVRLYAEDPARNFLPQSGTVLHWQAPEGTEYQARPAAPQNTSIRFDHALATGLEISPFYDPMLGKLMAWGNNREQARRRLGNALDTLQLVGPHNNQYFLRQIIEDMTFVQGKAHTGYLTQQFSEPTRTPVCHNHVRALGCALVHHMSLTNTLSQRDQRTARANWHSNQSGAGRQYYFREDETYWHATLQAHTPRQYLVHPVEGKEVTIEFPEIPPGQPYPHGIRVTIDQVHRKVLWYLRHDQLKLVLDGYQWEFEDVTYAPAAESIAKGSGRIQAPMDGYITGICVQEGSPVLSGDPLATMEAMKMEHTLKADCDGIVTAISITRGSQVSSGQLLIQIHVGESDQGATCEAEASRVAP
ncbi:biotin carboxylase N-terminal domain-containing protein [Microbulbifer aggregans]|uniref:ATP-binding protein n=1 Tax=Microbulbifer aggregans TaxID=1769779 RepID=UPI001CFD185A|nr:biotin carboxylase N-terminal domain-containing protein [Microbulbifer aggregans]